MPEFFFTNTYKNVIEQAAWLIHVRKSSSSSSTLMTLWQTHETQYKVKTLKTDTEEINKRNKHTHIYIMRVVLCYIIALYHFNHESLYFNDTILILVINYLKYTAGEIRRPIVARLQSTHAAQGYRFES